MRDISDQHANNSPNTGMVGAIEFERPKIPI